MVKPQFEVGRERVGKGGVVRDPALRREAVQAVADAAPARGAWAARPRRCEGPSGNRETFLWLAEAAGPGAVDGGRRVVKPPPSSPTGARRRPARRSASCIEVAARRAGITLRFTPDEARKHGIEAGAVDRGRRRSSRDDVDLCIVLGGDGTILTALRRYAGTGVPVFAVNYGEVGFLATIDPNGLARDFERAFAGEFETIELPTISVGRPTGTWSALNDISVHRKAGLRVADLAYALAGEEIGRVRCDGLVVATPQGSTGYNLANGGPGAGVGRGGLRRVVHRAALADGPRARRRADGRADDQQRVTRGAGRGACRRPPDARAPARRGHPRRVRRHLRTLAQLPGASFYHRLRERFGRLAR